MQVTARCVKYVGKFQYNYPTTNFMEIHSVILVLLQTETYGEANRQILQLLNVNVPKRRGGRSYFLNVWRAVKEMEQNASKCFNKVNCGNIQ